MSESTHVPKFPVLLTMTDADLESLLAEMGRHGDPSQKSDKEFVHELCDEIHHRRQNPKLKETP